MSPFSEIINEKCEMSFIFAFRYKLFVSMINLHLYCFFALKYISNYHISCIFFWTFWNICI